MKNIKISTKTNSYKIYIGRKILLSENFEELKNRKIIVIADSNAFNLHKKYLKQSLKKYKNVLYVPFDFSEKCKTPKTCENIAVKLLELNADRNTLIVAFGGGVTGDIVGFVSSVYMRGIEYIQIPTTLLSQVDSSIGGKTGVNLKNAKNVFGTITQPKAVIIDINFLKTLPDKQIKEGLAEVIKYSITQDKKLFNYLNSIDNINNVENLEKIIYESAQIKSKVVSKDEKETGLREVLNFGHTIGHAIEIYTNHKLSHGTAVSIGMYYESKISLEIGAISLSEFESIIKLLNKYEMPLTTKFDKEKLIEIMKNDKKNRNGEIMFVLLNKIGSVLKNGNKYSQSVDKKIIKNILS